MTDPMTDALNRIAATAEAATDTRPAGVGPHPYVGDADRYCQRPGCGQPDRNPIHDEPTAGHGAPVYADPVTGVVRLHRRTPEAAHAYLTDQLVRALAENAVMADALTRLTHGFEPNVDDDGQTWCAARRCLEGPAHPVHSTPEAIRGRLDPVVAEHLTDLAAVNRRLAPSGPDVLRRLRDGLTAIGDQP